MTQPPDPSASESDSSAASRQGEGHPDQEPASRPSLRQTAGLILFIWAAVALVTLMFQGFFEQSDGLALIALLFAAAFTAVALFDHLWSRLR